MIFVQLKDEGRIGCSLQQLRLVTAFKTMIEFLGKGKSPLDETSPIVNCPKSGHITPDETNVKYLLGKDSILN